MNRVQKVILFVAISVVLATASPKFGERINKKDDISNNNTKNNNQTDILEVFRPKGATPTPRRVVNINQLSASDSKQKPIVVDNNKKLNDTQQRDTNNNQNKEVNKEVSNERHVEYKYSAFHQSSHNDSDDNNSTNADVLQSSPAVLQHRTGEIETKPQPSAQPRHPFNFPSPPDFSEFQFNFPDITELAGSEHIMGPPVAPPPPQSPQQHSPMSGFQRFHPIRSQHSHQERNYEQSPNQQSFYESAPSHTIVPDFSFNIPNRFPHPNNDPRADFKQERMGAQNTAGKPFGTKVSYTYRDPKNPHNFMEMSEVRMTVNREMNPQEAQSQIQEFIAAAQNGQYGPLRTINVQTVDERHPNHNYEAEASQLAPEPKEPAEPKFPNF